MLKPGGRVIIADMLPHDRDNYRQQMGHVWLGFSNEQMETLLRAGGFEPVRIVALAADPKAKGPGLFVATGRKITGSAGSASLKPRSPKPSSRRQKDGDSS